MANLSVHGRCIEIPDLSKVMYPGEDVMKGDVLHYYVRVAPSLMPHVLGRTLSLRGAGAVGQGQGALSRSDEALPTWVRVLPVEGDAPPSLLVADEPAALAVLVQRSCITPYASLSRIGTPRRPDRLVFDLNPPDVCEEAFLEVCQAARLLGALIQDLGLVPFVMTSGSRGIHVHVPVYPQPFELASSFARTVAEHFVAAHRCRFALAGCDGAGGKITIDALPSQRRMTFVAPYGLRAVRGAPVAAPQSWDELEAVAGPRHYTISNVLGRLARRGDPWRDLGAFARALPRGATGAAVTA